MTRPTLFLVFAVVLAVGAVWWSHGPSEAAKKQSKTASSGTCADDLAKANKDLAAAREDARKAREEAKLARAESDALRKTEAERVKRLETQLGTQPVDTLK